MMQWKRDVASALNLLSTWRIIVLLIIGNAAIHWIDETTDREMEQMEQGIHRKWLVEWVNGSVSWTLHEWMNEWADDVTAYECFNPIGRICLSRDLFFENTKQAFRWLLELLCIKQANGGACDISVTCHQPAPFSRNSCTCCSIVNKLPVELY